MRLLIEHLSSKHQDGLWHQIEVLSDPEIRAQKLANEYGRRCKILYDDKTEKVFDPIEEKKDGESY